MKKKLLRVTIGIVALIFIAFLALSIFVGRQVFEGYTNAVSRDETLSNAKAFDEDINKLKSSYDYEKLEIVNPKFSSKIPALYFKKKGNINIICMVHGMGGSKETLAPLMKGFLDRGYDVIAYDQRNSGENQLEYNTFGVLESYDALAVIDFIASKYKNKGNEGKVILWGESMGALTSIIAAGRVDYYIDYLIIDSPVSNGKTMIEDKIKDFATEYNIPVGFFLSTGDWYSKYASDVSLGDMDGCKFIKNISKPILITNSKDDNLTPPYMANDLYDAINHDKKQIHTLSGYKHAKFPYEANDQYMHLVDEFIDKYRTEKRDDYETSK